MLDRDAKLQATAMLCRELAKLGLNVGLSDARPAAVIRAKGMRSLYVTVDASNRFFEWDKAEGRHSVGDPAGAATQLADQVQRRLAEGDES